MIVKPDGFFGMSMAIEGIADSTVLMHGPDGCRKSLSALTQRVYPRSDPTINLATPYYKGFARVPCTELEPCDYIYGGYDLMLEALGYIRERDPALVAVVCSPGASLIGDDCQKAIDDSGLTDRAIVLDADLSSKPINIGMDTALCRALEKLDPPALPTEQGTAVLLGNSVLQKDWESANEEMAHILGLMGIKVICNLGAGCTVEEMRRSVSAEFAIAMCPEYVGSTSRFYSERYGITTVTPIHSPIGFSATEEWIRAVASETGADPSRALEYVKSIKKRAYRRMMSSRSGTDTLCFAVDAEPSIALPLAEFFYKDLRMVPKSIRYNGMSYAPAEDALVSFLEARGLSHVLGAEIPGYVDILCTDGNTADVAQHTGHCMRGVDLRFPSAMTVDFLPQTIFGAMGALYILERVVNRFVR